MRVCGRGTAAASGAKPPRSIADCSKAKVRAAENRRLLALPVEQMKFNRNFPWNRIPQAASCAPWARLADRYISPGITAGGRAGVMYHCLSAPWETRVRARGCVRFPLRQTVALTLSSGESQAKLATSPSANEMVLVPARLTPPFLVPCLLVASGASSVADLP